MNKLNVGCGQDVRKGWINIDNHLKFGADFVQDLNFPLMFKDNYFDIVLCSHVLEDFNDPIPLIKELLRVCKGKVIIKVPYETSTWNSIYHKRGFTITAFKDLENKSHYDTCLNFKIISSKFYGSGLARFGAFIFNCLGSRVVDSTFIKYLIPNTNIEIIMEKVV